VLDARDAHDEAHNDLSGDILEQLANVTERYRQAPELIGMFTVLQAENLDPEAPLHDRFQARYRFAVGTVADSIRRGQRAGRYRTDVDPAVKAVEIVAFLTGMETSWLLDPSTPLAEVFSEYISSIARQLTHTPPSGTP
jgi:hypothetical protein